MPLSRIEVHSQKGVCVIKLVCVKGDTCRRIRDQALRFMGFLPKTMEMAKSRMRDEGPGTGCGGVGVRAAAGFQRPTIYDFAVSGY